MARTDFEALFLGPQAENRDFFKRLLDFLVDEHVHWRRNFHPDDAPSITLRDKRQPGYEDALQTVEEVLTQLSGKLKTSSMPWHSPRYLGHMSSDTLMPALLAYMMTMMYNPNNVAWEGAPATTALEIEVGRDLAILMGYDPERAWGHVCSGGHAANYEALWVARNLKSLPLALRVVAPELVDGRDEWELLNTPVDRLLELVDPEHEGMAEIIEPLRAESVRGRGLYGMPLGKVLVPQSKHYSWSKMADLLGLGQQSLVPIPVQPNYRLDVKALEAELRRLQDERTPVLAVVGVTGSTEEGAVDELHRIVELREELSDLSFFIHVDAAYGGYARAAFLDEEHRFLPAAELESALHDNGVVGRAVPWPDESVYRAFEAIAQADSVTVDPHKLGYVPYQAGAVVFRDGRARNAISYFAPYVFAKQDDDSPMLLGSYILEGSKAGAAAAAVWAAHRCVPLHLGGYGTLIGETIEGAQLLYEALTEKDHFDVASQRVDVRTLTRPDTNVVVYAFNVAGNTDLAAMNAFNRRVKEPLTYRSGRILVRDFMVSSTELSAAEYGDTPWELVRRFGIPESEWRAEQKVFVLRSCVMTPYLTGRYTDENYRGKFFQTLERVLAEALA